MAVRRDGSMPFDGAFPTLIEWPAGPHASEHMADLGCELGRLSTEHPEGERLSRLLDLIITDERVVVSSGAAMRIRATIATPCGPRELS